MKVGYVFTNPRSGTYKLGQMILPQLENGVHGVEVALWNAASHTVTAVVQSRRHRTHGTGRMLGEGRSGPSHPRLLPRSVRRPERQHARSSHHPMRTGSMTTPTSNEA